MVQQNKNEIWASFCFAGLSWSPAILTSLIKINGWERLMWSLLFETPAAAPQLSVASQEVSVSRPLIRTRHTSAPRRNRQLTHSASGAKKALLVRTEFLTQVFLATLPLAYNGPVTTLKAQKLAITARRLASGVLWRAFPPRRPPWIDFLANWIISRQP